MTLLGSFWLYVGSRFDIRIEFTCIHILHMYNYKMKFKVRSSREFYFFLNNMKHVFLFNNNLTKRYVPSAIFTNQSNIYIYIYAHCTLPRAAISSEPQRSLVDLQRNWFKELYEIFYLLINMLCQFIDVSTKNYFTIGIY